MIIDVSNDVRYADIGNLPSNFFPYKGEFSALNIRPFTVAELKLLSRAAVTKNVASAIKAIDQTIDVPIERITIGDYYYLMMWHKLHSFPKTPLSVAWECKATVPLDTNGNIVPEGRQSKYDYCNNPNAQLLHQTDIDIVDLPDDFSGINDEHFDYPRVPLLADLLSVNDNPEFVYLAGAAQWIKQGRTLEDKFRYLEQLPTLQLYEEAEELNRTVQFGVSETVRLKCSRCGNTFTKRLELDPANFFRPSI